MVLAVRNTEKMMGKADYEMNEKKKKSRQFSRSLFVVKDVKKGDKITKENVRSIRPGFGMHPKYYPKIIGNYFIEDISEGEPLNVTMFNYE